MADEGFHEIQLSGKQLVFLFMATTVASVVIFLCGVLVGRGVRPDRSVEAAPVSDAAAIVEPTQAERPSATQGAAPPPGAAADDVTYYKRLQTDEAPKETLKPAAPPDKAPTAAVKPVAPPPLVSENVPSEPRGEGFAIQIVALRELDEANALVRRLSQKGYPAYVVPPPGTESVAMYRVRVGKYQNRSEAERVVRRLKQEERFKPYITR